MAHERSPAFQFYPKDFLTDPCVIAMSLEERGLYITLLCRAWMDDGLPGSLEEISEISGEDPRKIRRIFPRVAHCFEERDGRYYQPRLERERAKQQQFRVQRTAASHLGVEARRRNQAVTSSSSSAICSLREEQIPAREAREVVSPEERKSAYQRAEAVHQSIRQRFAHVLPGAQATRRQTRTLTAELRATFEEFYAPYPRKTARGAAEKAWAHLAPDRGLVDQIIAAVVAHKTWDAWTKDDGKFIPYPATFLNQARWKDEEPHGIDTGFEPRRRVFR